MRRLFIMNPVLPSTAIGLSEQTIKLVNPSNTRILIVDDDQTILKVLRKVLERVSYNVIEACNGNEALELLNKNSINLVISDVYMPRFTGIDLLNEIKRLDLRIPVIIITGKASVEAAVECMKIGAFDYLSKPLSLEKIEEAVANALEHAHVANLGSDPASATDLSDHPSRFFGYKITGKLGEGNMGIVYKAEKTIDGENKQFALKVFRPIDCSEDELKNLRARFLHEARAASTVKHPNIVEIIEFGEGTDDISNYIVMEYIKGISLKHYMAKDNKLDYKQKSKIICQVADALTAIHNETIYHRDIKPANVLIDENLMVKVTDFGIARLPDSMLTQQYDLMGSPSYMAPESFMTSRVDQRADIFSLGILAYELFLGQHPFAAESVLRVSYLIRNQEPTTPNVIDRRFPARLQEILQKMLEKDPEDRYDTAAELYSDLGDFIAAC